MLLSARTCRSEDSLEVSEENGFVASYTHMGGKIGVLVDVETDVINDAVKEMAEERSYAGCSSETAVHQQKRSISGVHRS